MHNFTLYEKNFERFEDVECKSFLDLLEKIVLFSDNKIIFLKVNNVTFVCKKIIDFNILKDLLCNEIFTLRFLLLSLNPEIKHFYQELIIPSVDKNYKLNNDINGTFMFTKFIAVNEKIITFRDFLLNDPTEVEFRSCIFQIIVSLRHLQKKFPGFRHNDFKTDNILLKSGCVNTKLEIQTKEKKRFFSIPTLVQTVLIDFENAWWKEKEHLTKYDDIFTQELNTRFGIYDIECDGFDMHLLFLDILLCIKKENEFKNEFFKDFYIFTLDFIKPWMYLQENLTIEKRLLKKYQENFLNLDLLLLHPYFYCFRCNENSNSLQF